MAIQIHYLLLKQAGRPVQEASNESDVDVSAGLYGERPLNQSQVKAVRQVVKIGDIGVSHANKSVWVRGRLHTSRAKGKQCFVVLRQGRCTIQGIIAVGETTSKQLLKFVSKYGFLLHKNNNYILNIDSLNLNLYFLFLKYTEGIHC